LETIELRQQLMIYQSKKQDSKNITDLTRLLLVALKTENFIWGAPIIYSELLKLGYTKNQASQRTISRYLKKIRPDDPDTTKKKRQQWKVFLKNHRQYIMGMDFFTVPTISFKTLYVFFIIDHARRKIIHFNVTEHPTAEWVVHYYIASHPGTVWANSC